MATGERPFVGDTTMSVMSSIVKEAPEQLTARNSNLPRHLGRIVHRALAKDVNRRHQSALDLRNELERGQRHLLADRGAVARVTSAAGVSACTLSLHSSLMLEQSRRFPPSPPGSVYQSELKIGAAGVPLTLHLPSHSTSAGNSFQPSIACWKWSWTPASVS